MKQIINGVEIDEFTFGYLMAAFWTDEERLLQDAEEHGVELKCSPQDFPDALGFIDLDDLRFNVVEVCADFQRAQAADLALYYEARRHEMSGEYTVQECAGHDFWLNRNGHGVGFWDRGLGELGKRLDRACEGYGGSDIDFSDNGLFTFS